MGRSVRNLVPPAPCPLTSLPRASQFPILVHNRSALSESIYMAHFAIDKTLTVNDLRFHYRDWNGHGWPTILPRGERIPQVADGPSLMQRDATQAPLSGNFTWRDDFDKPALDTAWLFARVPKSPWADLRSHAGKLAIAVGWLGDPARHGQ